MLLNALDKLLFFNDTCIVPMVSAQLHRFSDSRLDTYL
jgi:hypothetical protein